MKGLVLIGGAFVLAALAGCGKVSFGDPPRSAEPGPLPSLLTAVEIPMLAAKFFAPLWRRSATLFASFSQPTSTDG